MSAVAASAAIHRPDTSSNERLHTERVLEQLLEVLSEPGAIHAGLATLVTEHARILLRQSTAQRPARGTAFNGKLTAIEGQPAVSRAEERLTLL